MGTSFIIPMLFLIFPFSDMVVNGMENDREDMRRRLKEEIKLELMEEMRREAQEDVESLLEKRLADLCGGRAAEQTLFFSHGSLLHLDRPPLIFNQCHFLSTPQSRLLSVQNEDILQQKSSRRNNHR